MTTTIPFHVIAEKIEDLRRIHIGTSRDKELTLQISRLFRARDGALTHEPARFSGGTETHEVILIEGAGGGKTTALLTCLENFAPLAENPETGLPRYLHAKVESPATLRSLGCAILKKLGVEKVSDRAKVYEVWDMVRHRLKVMGITLLWLDEAHDMFRSTTATETDNMFKMLKSLMQGDHPVVLVLSGTQRLSRITALDAQPNRRFNKICPPPLQFGADNVRLEGLVRKYATAAGLNVAIGDDQMHRLIHGSRRRFGRCIEIIIHAIEVALMDGAETLRMEHFEVAWGQQEGCGIADNVFAAENWLGIELADEDDDLHDREQVEVEQKAKIRKSRTSRKKAA